MEYVIILNTILLIAVIFKPLWLSWMKQTGKNAADISQNRDKEYESEKGRNLATKEDIEEITEKIEQVKSEISFKNQWEHDHIKKREERLIHILHLVNKIMMAQNRIIIKSRNAFNVTALFELIDEIDSYAVELSDVGNMLLIDYHQFKDITPATHLVEIAAKYAAELGCLANNVANSLQGSEFFKNRALEREDASSKDALTKSMLMNQQAQAYITQPLQYKEPTDKAQNDYILWLEQLYGKGVIAHYNITELTTDQQ